MLSSLRDEVTQAVRPALLAVVAAVLLLLAIACVNVTNLLLARGAQRRGEFAMRAALGAGRARLVRQLLTESLLLAVVGGVLGLAVAEVGVRALVALSPAGLPRLDAIRVDAAVLAFAFALSAIIGIVVGVDARRSRRRPRRCRPGWNGPPGAPPATSGAPEGRWSWPRWRSRSSCS